MPSFVPVRPAHAVQDVLGQISYAIRRGEYRPGDRLPGLDEMAQALGTSRPTVRAAYGLLVRERVLDVRRGHGGGAIVRSATVPVSVLNAAGGRPTATVPELLEARRPIETALARLAGRRGEETHFAAMAEAIELLEPARGNPAEWTRANDLFHYQMAAAAGSLRLARYAHEVMAELAILLDDFDEKYVDFEHTVWVHTETLAALRSRDEQRIDAVMDEHLRELEERFG